MKLSTYPILPAFALTFILSTAEAENRFDPDTGILYLDAINLPSGSTLYELSIRVDEYTILDFDDTTYALDLNGNCVINDGTIFSPFTPCEPVRIQCIEPEPVIIQEAGTTHFSPYP